jgi:hypothetical protein
MSPRGIPALWPRRPRNRSECKDGPRPCPWVSCRYHLALDVHPETETLKLRGSARFAERRSEGGRALVANERPIELQRHKERTKDGLSAEEFVDAVAESVVSDRPSCSLDIADIGGVTLEDCARAMGLTRERVRQIEAVALRETKHRTRRRDVEF